MDVLPVPRVSSHCLLHDVQLKVVELFSGIGGVSYAFRSLKLPNEPNVTAFDINHVANAVYAFNFKDKKILTRNLNGITASDMEEYGADVWTMSPPCQPFTRLGLRKDVEDNRADCFLHLIQSVLPHLKLKPRFLLIENVKGFESSRTRGILMQVLKRLNYNCREFLLSPSQIGIPNSRLRYYLIARLGPDFAFGTSDTIIEAVPYVKKTACGKCHTILSPSSEVISDTNPQFEPQYKIMSLEPFLGDEDSYNVLLSDKQLLYTQALDIVKRSSTKTGCFTRGYGHMLQGSGSVLQTNQSIDPQHVMLQIRELCESEQLVKLRELGLRFFTPREVANLMSFPDEFSFPDHVTDQQKYRLLGNSVNVQVVALMLKLLLLA